MALHIHGIYMVYTDYIPHRGSRWNQGIVIWASHLHMLFHCKNHHVRTSTQISKIEFRLRYRRFFNIDIWIWTSISKILQYRVLWYWSTDLQYRCFFISGRFNIKAYRLRYQSTDLWYQSYILHPISKLNHWPSISKVWYSILSIYRYLVFCFDIEAWQGSRWRLMTAATVMVPEMKCELDLYEYVLVQQHVLVQT